MKVTSTKQPQSSCPFKSARQKVYGLGYSLIIFIYDKIDNKEQNTSRLNILDVIFVRTEQTGDYQTTVGIRRILDNNGNIDDILAFFDERMLPLDEIQAQQLAKEAHRGSEAQRIINCKNSGLNACLIILRAGAPLRAGNFD